MRRTHPPPKNGLVPETNIPDDDGSAWHMMQDKIDPLRVYVSRAEQTVNEKKKKNMTLHPEGLNEQDPEMKGEGNPFLWTEYLTNEGLASLLDRDAQPRDEEMEQLIINQMRDTEQSLVRNPKS